MSGSEDNNISSGSRSLSLVSWSFLCCKTGISSSSGEKELPTIVDGEKMTKTDYSSELSIKEKQFGGWKAVSYILGNETFERLAVMGLISNFMVYLTREFHLDQVNASNVLNIWGGITNFLPLLGAFISDAYVGKFRTIAFASFFSFLGMFVVTLTSWLPGLHPPPCTPQQQVLDRCAKATTSNLGVLLLGLFFLSIGSAGIRPCSIPFGVDQFDSTTDEGRKGINSFFNWYYTTFTIVLLLAQTVIVYIQDSVSWKIGFAIPTVCMLCSIVLFFVGTRLYVHVKPEGSVFSGIAQVLVAAYRKRKVELPICDDIDDEKHNNADGIFYDPPLIGMAALSKLPLTQQYRCLNKAALIMEGELNPDGSRVNQWTLASIQQVEEAKCIAKIFPIWAAGILSLTSMVQQGTFTVSQALKMDRHLGPKFQIPAGSLSVISFLTIGFWVPFYDRIMVPSLRKLTKHEGGITLLQRIGIGMVFSILSMVVAGLVEKVRRDTANSNQNPLGTAPMSVLWLAPQLILMGLCEAFNIIGQIEFFNKEFPDHMRSIANSLFSCSFAATSYVSSILVTSIHHATRTKNHPDWLTKDLNSGRLDYFYYLIAGMAALNLVYFVYVSRRYHYKKSVELQQGKPKDVELGSHKA